MHRRRWSDVERARWRVFDEAGAPVVERAPQPYRHSIAGELGCFGLFFLPASGRYRVVADLDGDTAEGTVEAVVGKGRTLNLAVTKR